MNRVSYFEQEPTDTRKAVKDNDKRFCYDNVDLGRWVSDDGEGEGKEEEGEQRRGDRLFIYSRATEISRNVRLSRLIEIDNEEAHRKGNALSFSCRY